jgi:hypothetical protein
VTTTELRAIEEAFKTPLDVRYIDGRNWELLSELLYASPRIVVHIPAGFVTDFASIPRIAWRVISPTDYHIGKPAVVHDWLYRNPGITVTKEFADNELREAMKCLDRGGNTRWCTTRCVCSGRGHSRPGRRMEGKLTPDVLQGAVKKHLDTLPKDQVSVGGTATTDGDAGVILQGNRDIGKPGGWVWTGEAAWWRKAGGSIATFFTWTPRDPK